MNGKASIDFYPVEIFTTLDIDKNGYISIDEMEKSRVYLKRNFFNQTLSNIDMTILT